MKEKRHLRNGPRRRQKRCRQSGPSQYPATQTKSKLFHPFFAAQIQDIAFCFVALPQNFHFICRRLRLAGGTARRRSAPAFSPTQGLCHWVPLRRPITSRTPKSSFRLMSWSEKVAYSFLGEERQRPALLSGKREPAWLMALFLAGGDRAPTAAQNRNTNGVWKKSGVRRRSGEATWETRDVRGRRELGSYFIPTWSHKVVKASEKQRSPSDAARRRRGGGGAAFLAGALSRGGAQIYKKGSLSWDIHMMVSFNMADTDTPSPSLSLPHSHTSHLSLSFRAPSDSDF